ncbi:mRNA splicing protein [Chytridiales sp. JEL 0842]|nr:mRNA splicing protein [Chytridiales sp. JEL 0842]
MGRKTSRSDGPTGGVLPLQTDEDGKIRYDLVLMQGQRDGKIVHSRLQDVKEKDITDEDRSRPSDEVVEATTEKTKLALEKLIDCMYLPTIALCIIDVLLIMDMYCLGIITAISGISTARIKATKPQSHNSLEDKKPTYVRYAPAKQSGSVAESRIIRMTEAPVDPMEPAKFKHRKVPRPPPSPPPPVMHSPPRKVSAEEQANWIIPPCISNWKNAKGYTIPLDKRLAADGRGVQDIQINDNFAKLGEALAIADRHAREEVRTRAEMQAKLAAKAKREKEDILRELAQKAREERAGIAPLVSGGAGGRSKEVVSASESDSDEDDEAEDAAKVREREEIRKERQRQRERELRMSHMGADTKAKVLSKM